MNQPSPILDQFQALKHFTEPYCKDPIVEYQGKLLFIGDIASLSDQGSGEASPANIPVQALGEEHPIEKTSYINSRRNIGCNHLPASAYSKGFNFDDFKSSELSILDENNKEQSLNPSTFSAIGNNSLFRTQGTANTTHTGVEASPTGSENGSLPQIKLITSRTIKEHNQFISDSDWFIFKEVTNPEIFDLQVNKPRELVYDAETGKYFLLSNNSLDAIKSQYPNIKLKPYKVKAQYQVVSSDISAQEPLCSTLVTREKQWSDVFTLKNFKYIPATLQNINIIFQEYLMISKDDPFYIMFLHNIYQEDRFDLKKLNMLIAKSKLSNSSQVCNELKEHITNIINKFEAYKAKKMSEIEAKRKAKEQNDN